MLAALPAAVTDELGTPFATATATAAEAASTVATMHAASTAHHHLPIPDPTTYGAPR